MQRSRFALAILATATLLSGCAATVNKSSESVTPLAKPSGLAAKRVAMSLTRANTDQSAEDWAAFREEWNTSMTAAAVTSNASFVLLDEAVTTFQEQGLLLRAKANDFRYVSQAKRYAIGLFSGNASMDLDVEFIEAPAGKVLGSRKYSTSSSAIQGVFAAMTPKQVEATAKEIMAEITNE